MGQMEEQGMEVSGEKKNEEVCVDVAEEELTLNE